MSKNLTYAEQLRHPNWQRRRLEILERDGFECQLCFDTETQLHVHHKRYFKGRKAWEYEDEYLITVCENCHHDAHETADELAQAIALVPIQAHGVPMFIVGLIAAITQLEGGGHSRLQKSLVSALERDNKRPIGCIYEYEGTEDINKVSQDLNVLKGWYGGVFLNALNECCTYHLPSLKKISEDFTRLCHQDQFHAWSVFLEEIKRRQENPTPLSFDQREEI